MKKYRTIAGDKWDTIAKEQLGNEKYMDKLIEVNPEYMGITVFDVGTILNIPEKIIPRQSILPPWKR